MKERDLKQFYPYNQKRKTYQLVIALDNYRDAYSDWDYSPLTNRDLDEDLFDYLVDCSQEIGLKRKLEVIFHIPEALVNETREKKSVEGYRNYFRYRIRRVRTKRILILQKCGILVLVGILFLVGALFLQHRPGTNFALEVVSEGLFIGAWVAIWEIFSAFFFEFRDLDARMRHYQRLKDSLVTYRIKV